jgi:hypothetical protein
MRRHGPGPIRCRAPTQGGPPRQAHNCEASAGKQPAALPGHGEGADDQHGQPDGADPPGPARQPPPPVEGHRQQDAQEQLVDAGVGAHVDAVPYGPVDPQPGPQGGGSHDAGGGQGHQRRGGTPSPEHQEQHRRRHDVELLLDAQRPEVAEARRHVAPGSGDPVGHVEHDRGGRTSLEGEVRPPRHRQHGMDEQQDGDGGKPPQRPAGIEVAERHRSRRRVLLQQEGGDEEAAEHEEHVDAQKKPPGTHRPAHAGTRRYVACTATTSVTAKARTPSSPGR